jgi:hypothetical protein
MLIVPQPMRHAFERQRAGGEEIHAMRATRARIPYSAPMDSRRSVSVLVGSNRHLDDKAHGGNVGAVGRSLIGCLGQLTGVSKVVRRRSYVFAGIRVLPEEPFFFGSAQQSDEGRILGGFLKSNEFGLGGGQPLCLQQQIVQIAVAPATT